MESSRLLCLLCVILHCTSVRCVDAQSDLSTLEIHRALKEFETLQWGMGFEVSASNDTLGPFCVRNYEVSSDGQFAKSLVVSSKNNGGTSECVFYVNGDDDWLFQTFVSNSQAQYRRTYTSAKTYSPHMVSFTKPGFHALGHPRFQFYEFGCADGELFSEIFARSTIRVGSVNRDGVSLDEVECTRPGRSTFTFYLDQGELRYWSQTYVKGDKYDLSLKQTAPEFAVTTGVSTYGPYQYGYAGGRKVITGYDMNAVVEGNSIPTVSNVCSNHRLLLSQPTERIEVPERFSLADEDVVWSRNDEGREKYQYIAGRIAPYVDTNLIRMARRATALGALLVLIGIFAVWQRVRVSDQDEEIDSLRGL